MLPIKYPRTPHLPWSESHTSDDVFFNCTSSFDGHEVVVTEKLDGECLDGGTLITTNQGDVPISQICERDINYSALTLDHETQQLEFSPISHKMIKDDGEDNWYELEMEDGRKLRVTGNHLVWLPKLNAYRRNVWEVCSWEPCHDKYQLVETKNSA